MTHDYKRHGTTTLFAALERARRHGDRPQHAASSPSGVHPLPQHHRAAGPRRQGRPRRSSTTTPPTSIRRSASGSTAIERFTFHFTPTSCSWLKPSKASSPSSPSGGSSAASFRSLVDLQAAINRFVAEHEREPEALHMDRRPRQDHRRRQTRAPSVRFDPLAHTTWPPALFRPAIVDAPRPGHSKHRHPWIANVRNRDGCGR